VGPMTSSEKQVQANRANASKGGVKTDEGKAIVKYNALKHGLLAKEVVITAGEGAESQQEFDAVLAALTDQFDPQGTLEEILVEKIAVAYWRLRRAHKYEVGLIRQQLNNAADNYYGATDYSGNKLHRTDEEIDAQIRQSQESIDEWKSDKDQFSEMRKSGKDLKEIYGFEGNWESLYNRVSDIIDEQGDQDEPDEQDETDEQDDEGFDPANTRASLNKAGWTDDQIWQAHIELCDAMIARYRQTIQKCRKEKARNEHGLQVQKQLCAIPPMGGLDQLLKYEGSIERQFYKALSQLERIQRMRAGDNVPAPVQIDVDLDTESSR
jgi:hypothetical protein